MSQSLQVIIVVLTIFGIVGVGIVMRQRGIMSREADHGLLKLLVNLLFPAFFINRLLGDGAEAAPMSGLLLIALPLTGALTTTAGIGVAWLVARKFAKPLRLQTSSQQRTFALAVGMFNYGFIAYPVASAIGGDNLIQHLIVHNLGVDITLWTVGVVTMCGGLQRGWFRRMITAPTVTLLVCLAWRSAGLGGHEPELLMSFVSMVGPCAIPTALLVVGLSIGNDLPDVRANLRDDVPMLVTASVLRLGILPALMMLLAVGLAWLARSESGPADLAAVSSVVAIEASMPAAQFTIVLARLYGGDARTAVQVNLVTTLLCLVTMPIWLLIGVSLIPS